MKRLILTLLLLASQASAQSVVSNAQIANAVLGVAAAGGPFTYVAQVSGAVDTPSGTTITTSSGGPDSNGTLDIQTGDLLIAYVTWEDGVTTISSLTDGGSNTFTADAGDDVCRVDGFVCTQPAYRLAGVAATNAAFTVTLGNGQVYRRLIIMQYRPASGESASKDISGTREAEGSSITMATGSFSTTGTDNVVCGGGAYYTTWTPNTPLVAGSAATQTIQQNGAYMWCRIVSETLTTQTANVGSDQNREWVATAIAFKAQ